MATTMTKEEAVGMVKLLSSRSPENLSDFEHELMDVALDVIDKAEADSLKSNIDQGDVKELTEHWNFLQNIDVEDHGDVKKAQKILKDYGYYKGEVSGKYDASTEIARGRWLKDIMKDPDFNWAMIKKSAREIFEEE